MHHKPLLLMLGHILMYLFSLPLMMLGITRSLIIIYVILLRMHTHSCIIVGIVEEKGKNTVLGRKRLGKDFLSKKGRQTHTHISGAKGETITNIWSSPRRISVCRADSSGYLDFGRTDRGLSVVDRKRRVTDGQEEASSMLIVVLVYSTLLILSV